MKTKSSTTKCTYCKKKFSKTARTKKRKDAQKKMEFMIKVMDKQPTQTEYSKNATKKMRKMMTEMKKPSFIKQSDEMAMESCNDQYCNADCKGTVFEKGDTISPEVFKKGEKLMSIMSKPMGVQSTKNKKQINTQFRDIITEMRKQLFKGKKDVLDNSFYKGLGKAQISKLKKEGATSGCVKDVVEIKI